MGGALASVISRNLENKVYVSDANTEKATEFAAAIGAHASQSKAVASLSDFLFIGVKPNHILSVADEIKDSLKPSCVIVSMAAGVTTRTLLEYFGEDKKIIRIMPNTPVKVGRGVTSWCCSSKITRDDEETFISLMQPTGFCDKLSEELIDAACAVAGCGPAFVYMFIEALANGAKACGLSESKAILYAAKTLMGAAEMIAVTNESPKDLRDAVCSPGGSTIEGVRALEAGGLSQTVIDAVIKSYEKTKKLK